MEGENRKEESRDGVWKERSGRRKAVMTWRGLRMVPEKVRRRELRCLLFAKIVVLFLFLF